MSEKKIAIFGGSFDPIHIGHLLSVEYARQELGLDQVIFMPVQKAPHKEKEAMASDVHRLKMIELSIKDNPNFLLSDIEIQSEEAVSYTYLTIKKLKEVHEDASFYLFVGADMFADLPNWRRIEYILENCQIVTFNRMSFNVDNAQKMLEEIHPNAKVNFVDSPLIQISSTIIRDRLQLGKSVKYMLADPVIDYIRENKLYE